MTKEELNKELKAHIPTIKSHLGIKPENGGHHWEYQWSFPIDVIWQDL